MKIIIDAMGGDNGPIEVVKGAIDAVHEYGVSIILVGKEDIIENELKKYDYPKDKVEILNASDIITNEDDPAIAIIHGCRRKGFGRWNGRWVFVSWKHRGPTCIWDFYC